MGRRQKICGGAIPDKMFVEGSVGPIDIKFHSDSTGTGTGFKVEIIRINNKTGTTNLHQEIQH